MVNLNPPQATFSTVSKASEHKHVLLVFWNATNIGQRLAREAVVYVVCKINSTVSLVCL